MTNVGSVEFSLHLDRSGFDKELRSLSTLQVKPLNLGIKLDSKSLERQIRNLKNGDFEAIQIDLTPNIRGFERQLKNLSKSLVEPIEVEICSNTKGLTDELKAIAATEIDCLNICLNPDIEGFKRKLESLYKVDIDCLPIDLCPDFKGLQKKLREISKTEIDCLPVELCLDSAQLNDQIRRVRLNPLPVDVYANTSDLERKIYRYREVFVNVDGRAVEQNLTSAIDKGFRRANSKGLLESLTAPIRGIGGILVGAIATPLALGAIGLATSIGYPLGQKLGTGIAKGLQDKAGGFIGSFELLGEQIPKLGSVLAESLVESMLGSGFLAQIKQQAAKAADTIKTVIGEENVTIEAKSTEQAVSQRRTKATTASEQQLGSEVNKLLNRRQLLQLEQTQLKSQASSASNLRSQARGVISKVEQLPLEQKQANRKEIAEVLKAANADLAAADKAEVDILQRRADLIGESAQIEREILQKAQALAVIGSDTAEAFLDASTALTKAQSELTSIRGEASRLKQARVADPLSETVQQQRAQTAERLRAARASARAQQTELRSSEAALSQAGKVKRDPTSTQQFKEVAATNIQQLQEQLYGAIQSAKKAVTVATQVAQTVSLNVGHQLEAAASVVDKEQARLRNLTGKLKNFEILPTHEITAIQHQFEESLESTAAALSELRRIKAAAVKKGQETAAQQSQALRQGGLAGEAHPSLTPPFPTIYENTVQKAAQLAGLKPIPRESIPALVPSSDVRGRGNYDRQTNTYSVRPDLYAQIEQGDIDEITDEALGNILHEVYHAFQHGFGKAVADISGKPQVDLTPTPDELRQVAGKIESSVSVQPSERQGLSRQLETGANVFQLRHTAAVREQLRREKLVGQAKSIGGIGGQKISLIGVNDVFDRAVELSKLAQQLGVDISDTKKQITSQLQSIRQRADEIGSTSINLEALPTVEVERTLQQYQSLTEELQGVSKTIAVLRGEIKNPTPELTSESVRDDMLAQMRLPQIKRIARDAGVTGITNKNKQQLVDAIINSGLTPEQIKAKLPQFQFPTQQIVQKGQQLLQSTFEDLAASTTAKLDTIKQIIGNSKHTQDPNTQKQQLERVLQEIDKLELILVAAKAKSLDANVKNLLEGRIKSLQKQRAAASAQIRPLQSALLPKVSRASTISSPIAEQEIEQQRSNLILPGTNSSLRKDLVLPNNYKLKAKDIPPEERKIVLPSEINRDETRKPILQGGSGDASSLWGVSPQGVGRGKALSLGVSEGEASPSEPPPRHTPWQQAKGTFPPEPPSSAIKKVEATVPNKQIILPLNKGKELLNKEIILPLNQIDKLVDKKLILPLKEAEEVIDKKIILPLKYKKEVSDKQLILPPGYKPKEESRILLPPFVQPNPYNQIINPRVPRPSERQIIVPNRPTIKPDAQIVIPNRPIPRSDAQLILPQPSPTSANKHVEAQEIVAPIRQRIDSLEEEAQRIAIVETERLIQTIIDGIDKSEETLRVGLTKRGQKPARSPEQARQARKLENSINDRIGQPVTGSITPNSPLDFLLNPKRAINKASRNAAIKSGTQLVNNLDEPLNKLEQRFLDPNNSFDPDTSQVVARQIGQAKAARQGAREILGKGSAATPEDIERLKQYNAQLKEFYEATGQTVPGANRFRDALSQIGGPVGELAKCISGLVKGFIAFNVLNSMRSVLSDLARGATDAAIQLDKLQTSLNFASGGVGQGAKNLQFVREEVERLKIPLRSSQQGFTQLAAATRGTALAGKATKDIFTGVSEASTVLSLGAEETAGILTALTQIASKGKVQAEELRGQIGERIPGAFQIAARAMGVTEAQLSKMMETGLVASEEFLPRFAQQLHTEFGDAAVSASGNAVSAMYNFQNATLQAQEALGKTSQPAFVVIMNAAAEAMKFVANNAVSLGIIVAQLSATIAIPFIKAIAAFLAEIPFVQAGISGIQSGFVALKASILPMVATFASITAAIEIFKAASLAVNGGELTKQFTDFKDAAKNAVKVFKEAKNELATEASQPLPLPSANIFDSIINGLNFLAEKSIKVSQLPEGEKQLRLEQLREKYKLTSYAELDRDKAVASINQSATDLSTAAEQAFQEVENSIAGKTKISLLPQLDIKIFNIVGARKALESRIQREFANKGLATPTELKTQLTGLNEEYNRAVGERQETAKSGVDQFNSLNRSVEAAKASLRSLSDPNVIRQFGGEQYVAPLRQALEQSIPKAEKARDAMANLLATTKADPVLAMADAFRKLNLELAKTTERSEITLAVRQEGIARDQLGGFKSDIFASRRAAMAAATAERDKLATDAKALEADVLKRQAAIADSNFKPVLNRFGLTEQSTAADIQGVIDLPSTSDDDKKILDQLKAVREAELKLTQTRTSAIQNEIKAREAAQAFALDSIAEVAAQSQATTQQTEDARVIAIKRGLIERKITEERGAEELAQIQYGTVAAQKQSVDTQLAALRDYYAQGILSAETFNTEERKFVTQQSGLKRQLAEQELATRQAINARVLSDLEQANGKVEALINRQRTEFGTEVKRSQLGGNITEEQASQLLTDEDIRNDRQKVSNTRIKLEQNRLLEKYGVKSAKEAATDRLRLQQELADAQDKLVADQIIKEKQYRDEVQRTNERLKSRLELTNAQRSLATARQSLDALKAPGSKDLKQLDLTSAATGLRDRSTYLKEQIALVNQQIAEIPLLGLAEQDATDKRSGLLKELAAAQAEATQVEKEQYINAQEQATHAIEVRVQRAKNASDLAISNIQREKDAQDLLTQSLERTSRLLESRYNLQKAISDAALTQGQVEVDALNNALELRRKLDDRNLNYREKAEIRKQLQAAGFNPADSELKILKTRQAIENEIAASRLEALRVEQQFQRISLELDLRRQQVAAQTAESEAEIGVLRARQAQIEAQGELSTARAKGDKNAEAAALIGVEIANRQLEVSNKQLNNAKENLKIQGELANNAIAAQNATQQAAAASAEATEQLRGGAESLERVKTGGSAAGSSTSVEAMFKRSLGLDPAESAEAYFNRQAGLKLGESTEAYLARQQMLSYRPRVDSSLTLKPSNSIAEIRDASKPSEVQSQTNGFTQFVDGLKEANKDIVVRLDTLNQTMAQAAAAPRSLYVSSPTPVTDGARIWSDIARNAVISAGYA